MKEVFFISRNGKENAMSQRNGTTVPKHWYNIQADLPFALDPPLHPVTRQPVTAEEMEALFAPELVAQEFNRDREIDIPEVVQDLYQLWRPTPLRRARRLEQKLGYGGEIYYKYEGTSPVGSHKLNTALAQVYYNAQAGTQRIATETGAGQWGSALALAGYWLDLPIEVFMVRVSAEQKPERLRLIRAFGAKVQASPSASTAFGRQIREASPDCPGSLGIAISEALEVTRAGNGTKYALGSVLNHVLMHQTVIGLEAKQALADLDRFPDVVIACHGGGSNFGGISFPFLAEKFRGQSVRVIAAEPLSCPSLTAGRYEYDTGDTAGFTPLLKMYTLGRDFIPPVLHAGGLRYHGASPIVSALLHHGWIEAQTVEENEARQAARLFMASEGIVPAPESAHAIACALREIYTAQLAGKQETILFCLSGHGLLDLSFYD
jgi:tryptophan synthase beta chain